MNKRSTIVWQDAQGEQVLNIINTATGAAGIQTQLAAFSNAVIIEKTEGDLNSVSATPFTAPYITTRMTGVLIFRDSRTGSTGRLYVPAPLTGLFNSSGDTVDPTVAAPLISAAIGSLLAGSGNTVDMFVGGYLYRARTAPLESTDVVAFVNPMTHLGDMIYGVDSVGDAGRLPIGTSGQVLTVSGGIPVWAAAGGGSPTLNHAMNQLSADVSIASANTFFDGPSLSLAAGTWLLIASLWVANGTNAGVTTRLWDGTTTAAETFSQMGTNNEVAQALTAIVTLGGTTTMKASVALTSTSSGAIKAAADFNSSGNKAATLVAVQIA